jgi:hypothetical protein
MGRSFNISVEQTGFIPTSIQIGYAIGLLLLVPLAIGWNGNELSNRLALYANPVTGTLNPLRFDAASKQ